ncbi:class I SAM-dependent methyltransferase [Loktanella sp. IMCC34160]|uniref:class I SAM-dependent DNA methyltransferase n=1 Tax=Loktanella sp. IMCC34160 TaxID=2510646 RepID=UPI00101B65F0|nr:class I SAM-dependent methyltransferase [Loktanella sp. IMCC34160]RYG91250.1 class I SAM-dependent methyltransferase [Loktanella sp. IMCC34160]
MTQKPGLDGAYALQSKDDNRRLYADWAETYDSDFVDAMDYRLPFEVARQFAAVGGEGPVLDIGAGTGAVALHLSKLGVGPVDGTDISAEMLEIARGKGLYSRLFTGDVTDRLDVADAAYRGVLSAGTFTLGHVGPEAIDELLRVLAPGGVMVISVNARHWDSSSFAAKLESIKAKIDDLAMPEVAIYGPGATGEHATDLALIVTFRKR